MNNNNLTNSHDARCCIDYCRTTYKVAGQELVNNYRCDQPPFSASDLWRLRKYKKETTIRPNIQ